MLPKPREESKVGKETKSGPGKGGTAEAWGRKTRAYFAS
jgi:hypothetical protein